MASRSPRSPRVVMEITNDVIKDAVPRDSSHCMFAEAVKNAYPEASHVSVDLQTIRFTDLKKGFRYTYLTPRVAQVAIVKFDQGSLPEPFSCRLRNGQVTRSGNKHRSGPLTEKQREQKSAAAKIGREELKKARLASQGDNGRVPDRIGGKTPPTTPFARRREFGLRALER